MQDQEEDYLDFNPDEAFDSQQEFESGITFEQFKQRAKLPEYKRKAIRYPTLVKMLAKNADETKTKVRHILHHLAALVEYELRKGNSVQIEGFGTFTFKPAQFVEHYNVMRDETYESTRRAIASVRADQYMLNALNCHNDGEPVDWNSTAQEEFFEDNMQFDLYLKELDKIKQREEAKALSKSIQQLERSKGLNLGDIDE